MQDVVQIGMSEELLEVMEGVSAGDKVRLTFEVTVSEIDDERFKATVDMLDPEVSVIGSEEDDETDYEPEVEEAEDETDDFEDEEEE